MGTTRGSAAAGDAERLFSITAVPQLARSSGHTSEWCPEDFKWDPFHMTVDLAQKKPGRGRKRRDGHAKCQVEGCAADLALLKSYHLRYKICEIHLKADRVVREGVEQRFCQQCGRLHALDAFDPGNRSCRERLQRHNARRRKPHTARPADVPVAVYQSSPLEASGGPSPTPAQALTGSTSTSTDSEAVPQASEQEPAGAAAAGAGGAGKQRRSQRQLLAARAAAAAADTNAEAPLHTQPPQQESGPSRSGSTAYTMFGAAVSEQQLLLPQQQQQQHPSPGTSDSLASCDLPLQQKCLQQKAQWQQQCHLKGAPQCQLQQQQCQQKAQLLCPDTEPQLAACRLKGVPLLYQQQCQQYEQQCQQQFQEHQQEYQKAREQAYCTQGAPGQLPGQRACPQLLQASSLQAQQQAQPEQPEQQPAEAMEFDQLLLHSAFLNFATECDPDGAADEELQAIGSPDDLQNLMAPGEQRAQRQAQQAQRRQQPVIEKPAAASLVQGPQDSKELLPADAPLLAVLQQAVQINRRAANTSGAADPMQQVLSAPAAEQQPGAAAVLTALAGVFAEQVAAAHAASAAATASASGTAAPSPVPVAASPPLSTAAGSAQQSLSTYAAAASLTGSPAEPFAAHPAVEQQQQQQQQQLSTPLDESMLMDLLAVDAALKGVACYDACRAPGGSGSSQRNKRKHGSSSSSCSSGQIGAVHSDDAADWVLQPSKMGRAVSGTSHQCSRGSSLIAIASPMDSQQLSDGQATAAVGSPEWQQRGQVPGPGQAAAAAVAAMAAGAGKAHSLASMLAALPPSVRAQLPAGADERTLQLHLTAFAEAMAIVKASAPFPAPMPAHHSPALATSEGSAGPCTMPHHMPWQGTALAPGYTGMPGAGMQAGQLHAAPQQPAPRYSSSGLLTSLSIKIYNCLPHELPASLRLELLQALGGGLLSEGFIRQGCLLLTYDVVTAKGADLPSAQELVSRLAQASHFWRERTGHLLLGDTWALLPASDEPDSARSSGSDSTALGAAPGSEGAGAAQQGQAQGLVVPRINGTSALVVHAGSPAVLQLACSGVAAADTVAVSARGQGRILPCTVTSVQAQPDGSSLVTVTLPAPQLPGLLRLELAVSSSAAASAPAPLLVSEDTTLVSELLAAPAAQQRAVLLDLGMVLEARWWLEHKQLQEAAESGVESSEISDSEDISESDDSIVQEEHEQEAGLSEMDGEEEECETDKDGTGRAQAAPCRQYSAAEMWLLVAVARRLALHACAAAWPAALAAVGCEGAQQALQALQQAQPEGLSLLHLAAISPKPNVMLAAVLEWCVRHGLTWQLPQPQQQAPAAAQAPQQERAAAAGATAAAAGVNHNEPAGRVDMDAVHDKQLQMASGYIFARSSLDVGPSDDVMSDQVQAQHAAAAQRLAVMDAFDEDGLLSKAGKSAQEGSGSGSPAAQCRATARGHMDWCQTLGVMLLLGALAVGGYAFVMLVEAIEM